MSVIDGVESTYGPLCISIIALYAVYAPFVLLMTSDIVFRVFASNMGGSQFCLY